MARQAMRDNYPYDVFLRRFRLYAALGCAPNGAINQSIEECIMVKMTAAPFLIVARVLLTLNKITEYLIIASGRC